MRMTIRFEFDKEDRVAIANFYGDEKPADHQTMKRWVRNTIFRELDEIATYDPETFPIPLSKEEK